MGRWEGGSVLDGPMGMKVCTGWVRCEVLYWVVRLGGGSVLDVSVGGRVYWVGRWKGWSVVDGSVGGKVCTGWVDER